MPSINQIRAGDTTKPNPFTIAIVANPLLETPKNSRQYTPDPIMLDQAGFNVYVNYVNTSLFGDLPNQRERFVADPSVVNKIKVVSLFATGLVNSGDNALIAEDDVSNILIPRREVFASFLSRFGLQADVIYAVSKSTTHDRASAWFTTDDDTRDGTAFTADGATYYHRHFCTVPGTVAINVDEDSLTALHEFGHALSSYTNGMILDLYVDSETGLNNKRGRPIPLNFGNYNGTTFAADQTRDGLGYETDWQSYHCELIDPTLPAIMDNYWLAPNQHPEMCQHDKITRQFLLDRLRVKASR